MRKAPELPERPGRRDYFQIMTTLLMAGLGVYILWKTIFVSWTIPALLFSIAILLYSFFRIRMIWTYYQQRGRRNGI